MNKKKLSEISAEVVLLASSIGLLESIGWILRKIPHSSNDAILFLAYASLGYAFLTIVLVSVFLLMNKKSRSDDATLIVRLFCIPIGFFLFAIFVSFLEGGRRQLLIFVPASLALSILICVLFRKFIYARLANLFSLQRMLLLHLIALSISILLIGIVYDAGLWKWIAILVFVLTLIFTITAIFSQHVGDNNLLLLLLNIGFICCLMLMFLIHPGGSKSENPPIILITIDTLRPDHLGCYGNTDVTTPNINQVSSNGIQFNEAISQSPRTGPSHISILTGLYPKHHGAIDNGDWISNNVITLPEILSTRGYTTAAFLSGWTLKDEACGLRSRFDLYQENFSSWKYFPESIFKIRLYMAFLTVAKEFVPHPFKAERPATKTTDAAIKWIKSHCDRSFFLWVHYYDPHVPYEPPKRFRNKSDEDENVELNPNWWRWSSGKREELVSDSVSQETMISYYNGEISYVDEEIGRLQKVMDDLDLTDDLIQIVTADHGESLGEHNYYYAHDDLYDVCLRVPLIMKWNAENDLPHGVDEPVRLIDLTPTVLEILGINTANLQFDGKSVLSDLKNQGKTETEKSFATLIENNEMYSIRYKGYKLIWTSAKWDEEHRDPQKEELYDLSADPGEEENIIDANPEVLVELRKLLAEFKKEKVDVPTELTNEVKKRLRSLGYIK